MGSVNVVDTSAPAPGMPEVTARGMSHDIVGEIPMLSAPLSSDAPVNGSNDDVEMTSRQSLDAPAAGMNDMDAEIEIASPSSTGRHSGMSLGGLPIPRFNDPSTLNNPEYVGLDAATPMNTTFLSTLADSPLTGGVPTLGSLSALSINQRGIGRLDDVGEGEEEVDDVRAREPEEHLYT
jgi:hypothetical protein